MRRIVCSFNILSLFLFLFMTQSVSAATPEKVFYYGAVWCGPCQKFKRELLHDPDWQDTLRPYNVVYIDVDKEENQASTAKYKVAFYPMFVAVDSNGAEVARMSGYSGRESALRWFESLSSSVAAPGQVSPAQAAQTARWLASLGNVDEARKYLPYAQKGEDRTWTEMVVYHKDGKKFRARSCARSLLTNAHVDDWIWTALKLVPKGYSFIEESRLADLSPERKGLFLYAMGNKAKEFKREEDVARLSKAGIDTLIEFSGHCADYRAERDILSALYILRDDFYSARTISIQLAEAFPDEYTYYLDTMQLNAEIAKKAGPDRKDLWQETLAWADKAEAKAYGAQKLSVALKRSAVLVEMGDKDQARVVLTQALAAAPIVPEGQSETRIGWKTVQVQKALKELN